MRHGGMFLLALLVLGSSALAAAPAVVSSEPENGAVAVAVDVGVLRIHFDQDMNTGSWTLWKSGRGELPPFAGEVTAPFVNPRTFEVALGTLEPGTTYAVQLNMAERGRTGFRSAAGEPLADTVIAFRTADAGAAPVPTRPKAIDLGPARADPSRLWTVLVYMAADNDVERFAPETLNDIEAKFPAKGVEIVVLFDRAKEFDKSHGDWTDTRAYRVKRGGDAAAFESEQIASFGELNLGSAETLAQFITAGLKAFPAKHTCLLMWDHGMGWGGNAVDMDAPGAAESPDELTLLELKAGIAKGLQGAGAAKFDIVLFHMCLMMQIEIAAEMAPVADFMVASEAMIPCAVVPYGDLLASLAKEPDARAAAAGMVEIYRQAYRRAKDEGSTSSAVDLGRLPELTAALDALARKLLPAAKTGWPTMARSLFFSENYMGRTDYRQGPHATFSIDLMDAVRRIRANLTDFPAEAEYQAMERAFARCILDNYAGQRWRLSQGLAVYGPIRAELLNPAYRQVAFAKAGAWIELLDGIHATQKKEMTPPKIENLRVLDALGRPTKEVVGLSGTTAQFTVKGRNILWVLAQQVKKISEPEGMAVMFRTFIVDPRYETRRAEMASELVDLAMPIYVDGDNPMAKEVGGLGMQVTDGKVLIEATIDYSNPSDLNHARVPAIYHHPDEGTCRIDILFDVNWSRAEGVIGYIPVGGDRVMPKLIEPNPEADITLLYEVITPKGETVLVATGKVKWGEGLQLIPVFQDPGEYGVVVAAESIEGVGGSDMAIYQQTKNEAFEQLAKEGGNFGHKELMGEWALQNGVLDEKSGQVVFQETDIKVRFGVDPKVPEILLYEFSSPTNADLPSGVVLVDTRAAPCLIYFEQDESGEWKRTEFHIAFHTPGQGYDAFVLKDVFMGPVYRLVRKSDTPPPPPPPPPTTSLAGTWRTADGNMVIAMNESQYQSFLGGRLVDQGTYRVKDDKIYATDAMGMTQTITWVRRGNVMTFTYQNGVVLELTKVQ
jgi:Clostripain family/Bacterial Ig-like domain